MTKTFLWILFTLTGLSAVSFAGPQKFNCFTNYAGEILVSGKIRIVGSRNEERSLKTLGMTYFNGQEYVPAVARIDQSHNPDRDYKPRTYKGYMRYYLKSDGRGEGFELLLPASMESNFKGYLSYYNLEGSTSKFELLCRSVADRE